MIFGFLNPQSAMGFDLTQLLVCYLQDISKYPHESGQNNVINHPWLGMVTIPSIYWWWFSWGMVYDYNWFINPTSSLYLPCTIEFPMVTQLANGVGKWHWELPTWVWVNYNISLTWIVRPFGDDFPQSNHDFSEGEQWGRYNLSYPISLY